MSVSVQLSGFLVHTNNKGHLQELHVNTHFLVYMHGASHKNIEQFAIFSKLVKIHVHVF